MSATIQKNGHPRWYVPPKEGGLFKGLKINNSLTDDLEDFVPINSNQVGMYVCGPTVYNSAHMGHARAYLTFDIIRRILEEYFNYRVFYQINVTDIDDKIILAARKNELFRRFKEENKDKDKVVAAALSALKLKRGKIEEKLNDLRSTDPSTLLDRERSEYENTVKETEMKLGQCDTNEEKFQEAVSSGVLNDIFATGKDALCEVLDAEKGHTIDDKEIFAAHGRYFENEFLEDCRALGIRDPDLLTRVTEFTSEIVVFIQKIISEGFAYESNGSVYFDTQAFRGSSHDYPKLNPAAGQGATDAEIAEGEGALATGEATEKRHRNDFALWKASKPGEPKWESPWGLGRPGWHIECSVMASDMHGSCFDIHGGGSDLKFPHHDNEMAQSEAYHGCQQWVNYFMHAGTLMIKGLKMSKSLKNFITIREALQVHSARQLRLMFLLQNWDKPMNFSDQTIGAARAFEGKLKDFFSNVKESMRDSPLAQKDQKWSAADKALSAVIVSAQDDLHAALCNNMDTPSAMKALDTVISESNKYYAADQKAAKALLLRKAGLFIQKILRVFGVLSESDSLGLTAETDATDTSRLTDVVGAFSSLRDQLRGLAGAAGKEGVSSQELLKLCDVLRDETLVKLGVRIVDRPDGTAKFSIEDPSELQKEFSDRQAEKNAEMRKKEQEKAKNKLTQLEKELKKYEKALVPVAQLFRDDEKYSAYDEHGKPTMTAEGEPISNKARKAVEKELQSVLKVKEDLGKKGGEAFVDQLKREVDDLKAVLAAGA